jgi:hypothetical protein
MTAPVGETTRLLLGARQISRKWHALTERCGGDVKSRLFALPKRPRDCFLKWTDTFFFLFSGREKGYVKSYDLTNHRFPLHG